jgi:bifunctional non-homologous end joining protein LigD
MASSETIQGIRVFNAERVVYPLVGFTKRDVINYYIRIAPYILTHLKKRPVTLKRYPDEAGGQFFYEKDAPAFTPAWVTRFPVWRRSGG